MTDFTPLTDENQPGECLTLGGHDGNPCSRCERKVRPRPPAIPKGALERERERHRWRTNVSEAPLTDEDRADDEYVELVGDDIPYHLRPNVAPLAICGRCHRQSWDADSLDTEDRMTQPDGYPCGGRFEKP